MLTNKNAKIIHDYVYQSDITAYLCGAVHAYQLLARTHHNVDSDPTQKEWGQLMEQSNLYADEDVIDDLEYWKQLVSED